MRRKYLPGVTGYRGQPGDIFPIKTPPGGFKVITEGQPNEMWASGFYGEAGRLKAERMVREGYWHRFMYEKDRHKTLIVVPE